MKTVILAAGESSRFAKAGWAKPKVLLPMPWHGTLIEQQVAAIDAEEYYMAIRYEDADAIEPIIKKIRFRGKGKMVIFPVLIMEKTEGPLGTVWELRHLIGVDTPVLFMYCDVLPTKNPFNNNETALKAFCDPDYDEADARMVVFESDSDRFTDADMVGFKQSGIFWFRSGKEAYSIIKDLPRGPENGLPDVFEQYENRLEVPWHRMLFADIGVPTDYRLWMAKQGFPVTEDWEIWKKKI